MFVTPKKNIHQISAVLAIARYKLPFAKATAQMPQLISNVLCRLFIEMRTFYFFLKWQ